MYIYIYIPFSSLSSFLHFSCPAWQGFAIPSKSSGYAMQRGIAEVRVLALSARNYVRELWNFMYGVSVSKYANSIRPFLRSGIVPSSCKLSPRSNGLGFSFFLDPLHASILRSLLESTAFPPPPPPPSTRVSRKKLCHRETPSNIFLAYTRSSTAIFHLMAH